MPTRRASTQPHPRLRRIHGSASADTRCRCPKSESDRRADEALGVAFFPRCAENDPGHTYASGGDDEVFHASGCLREPVADSECCRSLLVSAARGIVPAADSQMVVLRVACSVVGK